MQRRHARQQRFDDVDRTASTCVHQLLEVVEHEQRPVVGQHHHDLVKRLGSRCRRRRRQLQGDAQLGGALVRVSAVGECDEGDAIETHGPACHLDRQPRLAAAARAA